MKIVPTKAEALISSANLTAIVISGISFLFAGVGLVFSDAPGSSGVAVFFMLAVIICIVTMLCFVFLSQKQKSSKEALIGLLISFLPWLLYAVMIIVQLPNSFFSVFSL